MSPQSPGRGMLNESPQRKVLSRERLESGMQAGVRHVDPCPGQVRSGGQETGANVEASRTRHMS